MRFAFQFMRAQIPQLLDHHNHLVSSMPVLSGFLRNFVFIWLCQPTPAAIIDECLSCETLLRHKKFPYPLWYEEGFAGLLESIVVDSENGHMIVGGIANRGMNNFQTGFNWDALISEYYSAHLINEPSLARASYTHAWMLAHYTTLGNNLENAKKLQQYFDLLKSKSPSIEAFETAFSKTPGELGADELKGYAAAMPSYRIPFDGSRIDSSYRVSIAKKNDYQPRIDHLKLLQKMRLKRPKTAKLRHLDGKWRTSSLLSPCGETIHIKIAESDQTIEITASGDSAAGKENTVEYKFEGMKEKGFEGLYLKPTQTAIKKDPFNYMALLYYDKNSLCMIKHGANRCSEVLRKCSD